MEDEVYELIDTFLLMLTQRNGQSPARFHDDAKWREALRLIKKYGFAEVPAENNMTHNFFITIVGERVINGIKTKKYIQEKQTSEELKLTREAKKLHYESVTAKWIYYTYWIVMFISVCGLGLSIFNFFNDKKSYQKPTPSIAQKVSKPTH